MTTENPEDFMVRYFMVQELDFKNFCIFVFWTQNLPF